MRDGSYTERDPMALDELASYELQPNGSYAAADGNHDDILMTRAIALHVCRLPHLRVTLDSDPTSPHSSPPGSTTIPFNVKKQVYQHCRNPAIPIHLYFMTSYLSLYMPRGGQRTSAFTVREAPSANST